MAASLVQTGGNILHRVSGEIGDANTAYVYFLLNGDRDWGKASMHWKPVATSVSFEFTNEDLPAGIHFNNATAAQLAALTWFDNTSAMLVTAPATAEGVYEWDNGTTFKLGRVKLLTTNATNSCDLFYNRAK